MSLQQLGKGSDGGSMEEEDPEDRAPLPDWGCGEGFLEEELPC